MTSFIIFIIILGIIILVHEFGHFLFSKLFGVYVHEYSIGMGKKIWSKKPKGSETEYSLRIFPIGGFCRLAGEEGEDGDDSVPENRKLYKKSFIQRFLVFFMGPGFNFILAVIVLFILGLIFGGNISTLEIADIPEEYPAYQAGLREGDTILEVDGEKVRTWTQARIAIAMAEEGATVDFKVEDTNGNIRTVEVTPQKEVAEDETVTYVYGIGCRNYRVKGFVGGLEYMVAESKNIFLSMFSTLKYLFTGGVSINDLSGPVGIYEVVDQEAEAGVSNLLYLLSYLSINVGVMNLIPFPAFDGGHILFLIIEKIRRKPVPSNIEATITGIGFILLIILMIYVTYHDIFNLVT